MERKTSNAYEGILQKLEDSKNLIVEMGHTIDQIRDQLAVAARLLKNAPLNEVDWRLGMNILHRILGDPPMEMDSTKK
jgi:hypothetical protein